MFFTLTDEAAVPFDWKCPKLCDIPIGDSDKASMILHGFVLTKLTPMIALGGEGMASVARICGFAVKRLSPTRPVDHVLQTALTDVQAVCKCLLMLADPAEPVCLESLDKVMHAGSGTKQTVRRAITQAASYRAKESKLRSIAQADMLMGPKIKEMSTKLKEVNSCELSDVKVVLHDLPRWKDSLRAGLLGLEANERECGQVYVTPRFQDCTHKAPRCSVSG